MPSNNSKYTQDMREQTARLIIESGRSATSFAKESGIDVDDQVAGLFDFDQAYPGTRVWDLAITLFSAVLPSCYDYEPSQHAADTRRRIRLFFDTYGMDCPVDIIVQTTDRIQIWCDEEAARDKASFASVHYQNVVAYLRAHVYDWV